MGKKKKDGCGRLSNWTVANTIGINNAWLKTWNKRLTDKPCHTMNCSIDPRALRDLGPYIQIDLSVIIMPLTTTKQLRIYFVTTLHGFTNKLTTCFSNSYLPNLQESLIIQSKRTTREYWLPGIIIRASKTRQPNVGWNKNQYYDNYYKSNNNNYESARRWHMKTRLSDKIITGIWTKGPGQLYCWYMQNLKIELNI